MKYRLILFDVDSTMTSTEGIDLMGELSPHGTQIADITRQAMEGSLDFESSIRARVALLKDLPETVTSAAAEASRISEGAEETFKALKDQGFRIGLASGGFHEIIEKVFAGWNFDLIVAQRLHVAAGRLTGQLASPIVGRAEKAQVLREFAGKYGIDLSETIAVGDGSNDIDMIRTAGLGIAYRAKAALRAVADHQIEDLREIIPLVS